MAPFPLMGEPTVRPEAPGDQEAILALNDAAFGGPVQGRIVDDIRGTDRWIEGGSMVAMDAGGRMVGHVLLSEGDLVDVHGVVLRRIWMLGPIAVAPEVQRQGVGAALMRSAIQLATDRKQPVICLLGHAEYYPRVGFESARSIGIEPPHPWSDPHWLALRLPAWSPDLRGTAHFPPAFPED